MEGRERSDNGEEDVAGERGQGKKEGEALLRFPSIQYVPKRGANSNFEPHAEDICVRAVRAPCVTIECVAGVRT